VKYKFIKFIYSYFICILERKFDQLDSRGDNNTGKTTEEEWYLQDVIFVEDVRHVPVGEVLKVDGAYAIVHFSSKTFSNDNKEETKNMNVDSMLKESVIRRKDELQVCLCREEDPYILCSFSIPAC